MEEVTSSPRSTPRWWSLVRLMITPSDVLKGSALPVAACPFRVGRRHNRITLDVREGSLANTKFADGDVRFTPKSGGVQRPHGCLLSAICGHGERACGEDRTYLKTHISSFANLNSFCARDASAEVNYRRGVMVRVSDHKDLKCRRCYQEETRAPAGHRSP